MDLLPKVFRTEGNIAEFDPNKIFESIIKETGMNETDAKHITELAVRRIISSGIKFLSGPHIREIVCSILSEQHFDNERKLYTRIGMPLMDYEELLEKGSSDEVIKRISPERINHWSANQIAEEYTHLRILTNEQSKAHLYGDIHINGLSFFDLRPFIQIWDPRLILYNGFPPINGQNNKFKLKPPKDLASALSQLSKWIGTVQNEFYGTQGLNLINIFLAPYVVNISEDKIKQDIQKLMNEINLLPFIIGRKISSIILSSTIFIPKILSNLSTLNSNKKISNIYLDFKGECFKLLKSLIQVFKETNNHKINNSVTNLHLILDDKFFEFIDQNYSEFWDDINTFKNISLLKFCLNSYYDRNFKKFQENTFYNFGILQNISLNLPRFAYISQNEDKFMELLNSEVYLCSEILLKKYQIIQKRLEFKQLPCCSSKVNNDPLFNLKNQDLSFSLVGLNESIKFLTNYELHEHSDAVKLSLKILSELDRLCAELTEKYNKRFIISENISKKAIKRFTNSDLKHFLKDIKLVTNDLNYEYTNSIHIRDNNKIDLLKRLEIQGELHRFIKSGAIEFISLNELKENGLTIQEFLNIISKKSKISSINFYS